MSWSIATTWSSWPSFGDMGDRLTRLEPGQAIVFGGDRVTHVPPELAADFQDGDRVIVVQETGRTLAADLTTRTLSTFLAASAVKESVEIPAGDALGREIAAFLDAVAGQRSVGVGGRDAVAALDVAEAIREEALRKH